MPFDPLDWPRADDVDDDAPRLAFLRLGTATVQAQHAWVPVRPGLKTAWRTRFTGPKLPAAVNFQ